MHGWRVLFVLHVYIETKRSCVVWVNLYIEAYRYVAMNFDLDVLSEGESSHNSPRLAPGLGGPEAGCWPGQCSVHLAVHCTPGQHCHEVGQALPPTLLPLCLCIRQGKQQVSEGKIKHLKVTDSECIATLIIAK